MERELLRGPYPRGNVGSLASLVAGLPGVIGIVDGSSIVLADSDTTVDRWVGRYGGALLGTTLSAPAATNRPAWDAANREVDFDGSDNLLRITALAKGSTWGAFRVGGVWGVTATGGGVDQIIGYGNAATERFSIRSASAANFCDAATSGGATSTATTPESSTKRHWWFDWSGTSQRIGVAGAVEDTDAAAPAAYADGLAFFLGARADAASACAVSVRAWYVMTRVLTSGEEALLRLFLTISTGVAS